MKKDMAARQAREVELLNAIIAETSQSADLAGILKHSLQRALRLVDIERGGIYLLDEHSELLKIAAVCGLPAAFVEKIDGLKLGEGFSGQVAQTGEPQVIPDLASDPRLTRMAVAEAGLHSVAVVSIASKEKILGTLFAITSGYREFQPIEVELLTSVGSQIGVAIENARLLADTQNRLAQLTALQATSRAVVSTLDLNALLDLIVRQATKLLQADGGILNLANLSQFEDEVVACAGTTSSTLGIKMPLDQTLSGWVTLHNQPAIVNDVSNDPRVYQQGGIDLFSKQIANGAVAPLAVKDQVIGTLAVVDKLGGAADFEPADLDLLVGFASQAAAAIENARLYAAERRRAEQFRVIAEIGRRLTLILDLEELLKQVVTLIQETFGYYHVAIGLIEGDEVVYQYGAGELWQKPGFHLVPSRLKVGHEGLSGWVAAHGTSLNIPDVTKDPRYVAIEGGRGGSELIVPILSKEQVIGTLDALSDRVSAFDETDLMVMQSLAHQVGAAIENTRLFQAEKRRAEQFRVIAEIGRRFTQVLDLDELLKQVVTLIQEALGYYHIDIGLIEGDEVAYQYGAGAIWDRPNFYLASARLKVGKEGLGGWVAASGEPLYVPDVSKDPRYVALEGSQGRSELVIPITAKGRVIGVLNVLSDRLNDFDDTDLLVMQSLAHQVGAAIENARLFHAEQRRAEQFRVIGEVGRRLISVTIVDELLEQMAHLIQESFGYYHVGIGLIEGNEVVSRAEVGACEAIYKNVHIPLGQGSWGWVAQQGDVLVQTDAQHDPHFLHQSGAEKIRSHICVPLQTKNAVMGVLSVASDHLNAFDASDQMVLQSLAQQAAVAIENIRFHERAQHLAVMEERSRLARELHDAVTQTLFSASLIAEAVPTVWEKDLQQGRNLLQELRSLSRGALAEMRTLLLELRPAALVETKLEDLLRQLGEAASGREGIPIKVLVEGNGTLPPEVHIALYRIAQEALNNVVKHARASQVIIRLCYTCGNQADDAQNREQSVLLSIIDNGRGFDLAQAPHHRLGLGIMQERANAIGANLFIDSQPGEGTQVTVMWE